MLTESQRRRRYKQKVSLVACNFNKEDHEEMRYPNGRKNGTGEIPLSIFNKDWLMSFLLAINSAIVSDGRRSATNSIN